MCKQARKELYAFNKKHKVAETAPSSDEDKSSVASLHNVEALANHEEGEVDEIDLAGFNYGDMDNLKIDSSDNVSV